MHVWGARIWSGSLLALLLGTSPAWCQPRATDVPEPADLPRYDLQIDLEVAQRLVRVRQVVTWTNCSRVPVQQIVFNAHAHYSIPDKDIGLLAKMVEILRMAPKEALNFDGPALRMEQVCLRPAPSSLASLAPSATQTANTSLRYHFPEENLTALVVALPADVKPGEAITLELVYQMKLPPKKGRWGQWEGITTLAQWVPVVAVFDEAKGWQPTPFIPWHQPFFNDAGHYTVQVRLPCAQKLAASAAVKHERDLGDGRKEITFEPICVRDFALIASARFREWTAHAEGVQMRCLALPENEFYAKIFLDTVCQALPIYNRWFGKYPYPQFTIVESCFGWNGNECGALVMIDDRMFNMPHMASNYPTYLVQHEFCHQWWYNTVGTNGYAETWMDEGLATYFSHRLADQTMGKNNALIHYPRGLQWLPNIHRDDFRNYGMVGTWARGDGQPCVPEAGMPAFGHLVNLTSAAYDRGSKVVGMIEERMGEPAFYDFMRHIYRKYQFRILRVADFQHELESFTGHSWEEFFRHWVYSKGRCDWAIERVETSQPTSMAHRVLRRAHREEPTRIVVHLRQQGEFNEPTTLGIRLHPGDEYQIRIPIHPDMPVLQLDEVQAVVHCSLKQKGKQAQACVKVEIILPCEPLQIMVDPDRVLVEDQLTNNRWKREIRWHLIPLFTQLEEIDVANAYDRWNVNLGPWVYVSTYSDPWFTKSSMAGFRANAYRTQEFNAGAYIAYRSNDRNVVVGTDALWDHMPLPNMQLGMNLERAIDSLDHNGAINSRGVIYGRYILMYGSSLYLPPFEYVEAFGMMQDRALPDLRKHILEIDPYHQRPSIGINYHKNLLTPYWDPEGGLSFDATYQYGIPILGNQNDFHEVSGQLAFVKGMPKFLKGWHEGPILDWLYDSRFAFRLGGSAGLPERGLLFSLGGGDHFRGFDLGERQGSLLWLGSAEWRLPLATNLPWDYCDHILGVRNIYLAPFYDVGNAYVNGKELGQTAHAVGLGLRVDVTWLGLIERTMLRFDVAKTLNSNTPFQFWFGMSHPF